MYLGYHTKTQVLWGVGIGIGLGVSTYVTAELIPVHYPNSVPGRFRKAVLLHPISTWIRIKDGWAVWDDGGREVEWQEWRRQYERMQTRKKD